MASPAPCSGGAGLAQLHDAERIPGLLQVSGPEAPSAAPACFFLHIPKTAGTAVADVLASMFDDKVHHYHTLLRAWGGTLAGVAEALDQDPGLLTRQRAFFGHMTLQNPMVQRCQGPRLFLSVLRDPVARVVSFYDFIRLNPGHVLQEELLQTSLLDAFRGNERFRFEVINAQLRIIFGSTEPAQIEARLASEPHVLGRATHLEDVLVAVEAVVGRRRQRPLQRLNLARRDAEVPPASRQPDYAQAVAEIRAANRAEYAFMRYMPAVLVTRGGRST